MSKQIIGVLASAAGWLATGSALGEPSSGERYIREREAAWVAAEASGNPTVAREMLAEDYVGVFPDGTVGGKAEAVSFFKPQTRTLSGQLDYVHIRFFGDIAVAQGQETDTQRPGSAYPSGHLIFTDVWRLRNGKWQIVNSEDQFQPLTPK